MEDSPSPGFHPDELDDTLERWWDGEIWGQETRPRDTVADMPAPDESALLKWDRALLPGNGLARFIVLRPTWQIIAVSCLLPVLSITASLALHLPDFVMLSFLIGLGLFAYATLLHSKVRQRCGFLGEEPGHTVGKFVLDLVAYTSDPRNRVRDRRR